MSVFDQIRENIPVGTGFHTPVGNKLFTIASYEPNRLIFSVGANNTLIPVPRACWDNIPGFLRGRNWVKIGAKHDVADSGTFSQFLDTIQNPNQHRHPNWASYIVPVLEHLRIVEVDHSRPSRIRLR